MGNWQLEIFKMAVYMAFPVTSFYVYHQVQAWINSIIMHPARPKAVNDDAGQGA